MGDLARAQAFDAAREAVAPEGDGSEARLPNVCLDHSAHIVLRKIVVIAPAPAGASEMRAHAPGLQAGHGHGDVDEAGALVDRPRAVAEQRRISRLHEGIPYLDGGGRGRPLAEEGGGPGDGRRGEGGAGLETERRRDQAGQACVAVGHEVEGEAGALDEARDPVRHHIGFDPPIGRGTPGAERGGLHVARGAEEGAISDAELDVTEDALMDRAARRADRQRADAGAGGPAGHRRRAAVARTGHDGHPDLEHTDSELVLELAAREEGSAAKTHVHDLDVEGIEDEGVLFGAVAGHRIRRDAPVVVPPQGDGSVHCRDDVRIAPGAGPGVEDLEGINTRGGRGPDHGDDRARRRAGRRKSSAGNHAVGSVDPERPHQAGCVVEEEGCMGGDHGTHPCAVGVIAPARGGGDRVVTNEVLPADHGAREGPHDGGVGRPRVDDGHDDAVAGHALAVERRRPCQPVVEVEVGGMAGDKLSESLAVERLHRLDLARRNGHLFHGTRRVDRRVLGHAAGAYESGQVRDAVARDAHRQGVDVHVEVVDVASQPADRRDQAVVGLRGANDQALLLVGGRGHRGEQNPHEGQQQCSATDLIHSGDLLHSAAARGSTRPSDEPVQNHRRAADLYGTWRRN